MKIAINRVNFTFALPDGMWIEYENGERDWKSFSQLQQEVGQAEFQRLYHIAYANGWTGMWYAAGEASK
jgi:hypothetical protein